MAPRYISNQARSLHVLSQAVTSRITGKFGDMDRDTRDVVITALVGNITEINTLLRHPSVRGYLDTSIGRPEIDETSSLNDIVRRLKRQVRGACILADTTHTGPEANIWETEALTRTSEILEQTFDDIYQAPSRNGSYTATASD